MGLTPVVMGQPVKANRPLRNARRHTTEHNKNYAILKFPQTYPGLGTPTDSGTFAWNLNWFIKSWVWYGLFVVRICWVLGRPQNNAPSQPVKANRPLCNARGRDTEHNKNYAILKLPQTYPGLGTPTDSGTFAGNLNWSTKSWVWYGLFVISICLVRGRPRDNADTPLSLSKIMQF